MRQILIFANRFKRLYTLMFQPLARAYDLNQLEIDILLFLSNNPKYNTARDIVKMRGFQKSNVSQALTALMEKRLLTAGEAPASRKVRRLALMPRGLEVAAELVKCQKRCFDLLKEGFSPEELEQLERFWQRMEQNLSAAIDHSETTKKER